METFLIDVPMPSMGATVNELTIINLKVAAGAAVTRGQKIAELESDKSVFEFESPCDGAIRQFWGKPGQALAAGAPLVRIETADASVRHLLAKSDAAPSGASQQANEKPIWTPRAVKLAQEAGLDPDRVEGIEATGPGKRVSGDDVARYLKSKGTPSS